MYVAHVMMIGTNAFVFHLTIALLHVHKMHFRVILRAIDVVFRSTVQRVKMVFLQNVSNTANRERDGWIVVGPLVYFLVRNERERSVVSVVFEFDAFGSSTPKHRTKVG